MSAILLNVHAISFCNHVIKVQAFDGLISVFFEGKGQANVRNNVELH